MRELLVAPLAQYFSVSSGSGRSGRGISCRCGMCVCVCERFCCVGTWTRDVLLLVSLHVMESDLIGFKKKRTFFLVHP